MTAALAMAGISFSAGLASAHVSVAPATGTAAATTELFFNVGHGCENADTLSITVDIPAGVTGVRGVPNAFGKLKVNRDAALNVVSVSWEKAVADLAATDDNFYKLGIRAKLPDAPFTTVYFAIHQVCQKPDGTKILADWVSTTPSEGESGPKPAGSIVVLPARKAGWNKFKVPAAIEKLETVFADAEIVWKGNAGFSTNPATVEQIKATAGASALTTLAAGDEIWVKY
ncbi:MAG: DUF1775 domain-containing protein [Polyangiales bacterium]